MLEDFEKQGYINFGRYFRIFEEKIDGRKTPIYHIYNHELPERVFLGDIKWNGAWRKYCFYPASETLWDSSCLQCVVDFIGALMEARK